MWVNIVDLETGIIALASVISAIIIYRQADYMSKQTKILEAQTNKTNKIIEIEQKRDQQAYKISGWLAISGDSGDIRATFSNGTPSSAQVFNGSNQPIYEVTGQIWNKAVSYPNGTYREVQNFDLGTVRPNDIIPIPISKDYLQEQIANFRAIYGDNFADFSNWLMKTLEISFTFRDSEEIWWERTIECRMRRMSGS